MDNNAQTKTDTGASSVSDLALRERVSDRSGTVAHFRPVTSPNHAIIPRDIDDVMLIARGVASSGLAPRGMDKPEQIAVAILTGLELGLPPMFSINKIAVIQGRPTLWGDALPALLWGKGFEIDEWSEGEGKDKVAFCKVTRPGGKEIVRSFSVQQAVEMGLWNKQGPWKQMPWRMLQMRARGFACRDGAADVLGGVYITEEMIDAPPIDITPKTKRKSSAAAKKDGTDELFNNIRGEIDGCESGEDLLALRTRYMDSDGAPWEGMPSRWSGMLEDDFLMRAKDLGLELGESAA